MGIFRYVKIYEAILNYLFERRNGTMKSEMRFENGKVFLKTEKNEYTFGIPNDALEMSEEGRILLRKSAISNIIATEGIKISEPKAIPGEHILIAGRFVIMVSAKLGDEEVYEIGSAHPDNLTTSIAALYPLEMAHNRAKQRAVLSLLGLGGVLYGEDEIDKSEIKTIPSPIPIPPTQSNYKPPVNPQAQNSTVITDDSEYGSIPNEEPSLPQPYGSPQANAYNSPAQQNRNYGSNGMPTNISDYPDFPEQTSPPPQTQTMPNEMTKFIVKPEHTEKYPWLTQMAADEAAFIDPDTYIMEQGRDKQYRWTATQTLINDRDNAEWYASRPLSNNQQFNDAVLACRAAIIKTLR